MWPFRGKSRQSPVSMSIVDIATTVVRNRAHKFHCGADAYIASVCDVAARIAHDFPANLSGESFIDEVKRRFTMEEFSLLEDVCDGSQEAFA